MTMSVGLGKIQNDPDAPTMTRKALGALSTPGLLVHDTGLSIDNDGRIIIKLKADGGLQQDENGLSVIDEVLAPPPVKIGIDSEVDPRSEAYDRDWNARLTGPAPNYFEGSLAIGAETFAGVSAAAAALGITIEDAKVNITSKTTQLRLSYDTSNYMAMRVLSDGSLEVFSVSADNPGINFITGDGVTASGGIKINSSTEVEAIYRFTATFVIAGGGAIGAGIVTTWTSAFTPSDPLISPRTAQDHVTACPANGISLPTSILSYWAQITALNEVTIKIITLGPIADINITFIVLIHKLPTP